MFRQPGPRHYNNNASQTLFSRGLREFPRLRAPIPDDDGPGVYGPGDKVVKLYPAHEALPHGLVRTIAEPVLRRRRRGAPECPGENLIY